MTSLFAANKSQLQTIHIALDKHDLPLKVDIKGGSPRTLQQNAYLWGVVYPTLLELSGLKEQGWEADDIHEYLLEEHFGFEELRGARRTRTKPLKRSSRLSTSEFAEYVEFIQRKAAGFGVYIPDPEEQ